MEKNNFRFSDPNEFFKEFASKEISSILPKATQNREGLYPARDVFAIMRIEEFSRHIKFPLPPGRSTVYEFCWLKKGEMGRTDALKKYIISEGCICFYAKGTIKSYEYCKPETEGYYVLFDKDFVLQFLKHPTSIDEFPYFQEDGSPLIKLNEEDNKEIERLLIKIEEEHLENREDKHRMIGLMLLQLLVTSKRQALMLTDVKTNSAAEILTHRFAQAVKQHILKERSISFYADLLNVSPNHLNKCVKESSGKPASEHVSDMIMLEAKVMLKQTTKNISEIAIILGFENISYFTRIFKKINGVTPKEYRDNYVYPVIA